MVAHFRVDWSELSSKASREGLSLKEPNENPDYGLNKITDNPKIKTLKYKKFKYTLEKDKNRLVIEVSDDWLKETNTPKIRMMYRIAVFLDISDAIGYTAKMFDKKSHVHWENGKLVKKRASSAYTWIPNTLELIEKVVPFMIEVLEYLDSIAPIDYDKALPKIKANFKLSREEVENTLNDLKESGLIKIEIEKTFTIASRVGDKYVLSRKAYNLTINRAEGKIKSTPKYIDKMKPFGYTRTEALGILGGFEAGNVKPTETPRGKITITDEGEDTLEYYNL